MPNRTLMDLIGKESLPSVFNDPFKKTLVNRIYVSVSKSLFHDKLSANGSVEFKNGNTTGEQRFEGDSFDEVVGKIKYFIQYELK